MGAKSALSVEQYLHTSFPDLDKEYRDGELVERSLPTYPHGKTQLRIGMFFAALPKTLALHACVETRMKIRTGLYLIPDVAIFQREEPLDVPEQPPLVAIEILSPDDRLTDVSKKLEEYRAWGVPDAWAVDPVAKRFYACEGELKEVENLQIPELGVILGKADLFE
jgi:Uma2 family endonuclease